MPKYSSIPISELHVHLIIHEDYFKEVHLIFLFPQMFHYLWPSRPLRYPCPVTLPFLLAVDIDNRSNHQNILHWVPSDQSKYPYVP